MTHLSRRLLIGWLALVLLSLNSCGGGAPGPISSSTPPGVYSATVPEWLCGQKTVPFDSFPHNVIQWGQFQAFHLGLRGVTANGSARRFYPTRLSG
jgi:hypothetical protein